MHQSAAPPTCGGPATLSAMATPWSAPGAVSAIRARRDTEAGFAAYQRGDLDEATERFTRALNRRAKQPPSAETAGGLVKIRL